LVMAHYECCRAERDHRGWAIGPALANLLGAVDLELSQRMSVGMLSGRPATSTAKLLFVRPNEPNQLVAD
jgi:hypothetical protein